MLFRKIHIIIATLALAVAFVPTAAFAGEPAVQLNVNGQPAALTAPLILDNGQTKIALSDFAKILNLTSKIDASTGNIALTNDKYKVNITLGDYAANANGTFVLLNSMPSVENDVVYVPLSQLASNAGAIITFNADTKTIDMQVPKNLVKIFHAGSVATSLGTLTQEYTKSHPDTKFVLESSGSVDAVKKVTAMGKTADIIISADYATIQNYMFPATADWNLNFAGNRMVLMYTDKSKLADKLTADNWYTLLSSPGAVKIGNTDPNLDPGGYRCLMTMKLAEKFYNTPGLYDKLVSNTAITVNKPYDDLTAGNIDYIIGYESSAKQNGFKTIDLPKEINLDMNGPADYYKTVTVKSDGKDIAAAPIQYGLTIPKNAVNPDVAIDFIKLLDSDAGRQIIEKDGLQTIHPLKTNDKTKLPDALQALAE